MIKHSDIEFFGTFGYEAPKSNNDKKVTKVSAKEKAALAKIDKRIELIKAFIEQNKLEVKEPKVEEKPYRKWIG